MIIFKINNLICFAQGGEAGGGYTGGGSTGNYSGAATGFGKSGYGSESEGMPGIFGGGVFGGIPGISSNGSTAAGIKALKDKVDPETASAMLSDLAQNNMLQNNPDVTNALFSKLSKSDAWTFSQQAYSVPTTLAIGWGIAAPMAAGANMMSKVGAALATMSGILVGSPEGMSVSKAGANLTNSQKSELQKLGINQSDLDSFTSKIGTATPQQLSGMKSQMLLEQDTKAATALVSQLTGMQPGGGRDGGLGVEQVLATLKKGGRALSDMTQGGGIPQWWTDYVHNRSSNVDKVFENPSANVIKDGIKGANMATAANNFSMEKSVQAILEADTNIEYNHTLADLSGIKMDKQEKKLLYAQKEIAIDRAITEIEDTFSFEGESMVAQQIQNLGENALGGTIGQGFVKRWQEREAAAKTGALQDIESTYLSAERQAIDTQKQRQVDIWGKEFEADKASVGLGFDKIKTAAMVSEAGLDRSLKERMGDVEIDAWEESNKWAGVGGVAGAVAGSDWFGEAVSSIWS